MKKDIYCVGNAHLDPAWMWNWQEGSAEAKATIRSALDRMKEFEEFRFVCSSASIFEWIEEFDKPMFEEIKQRVAEGRFVIVGGNYVQPDCNLPSGEGFARQSLYSQRYFFEKFGVTAKVGYNVDSFGHNGMLPQILKKSGMDSYIFMRPSPREKSMDSNLFYWVAPDGSKVLAYRLYGMYCFQFAQYSVLKKFLEIISDKAPTDIDAVPLFYGVGNHGGGPTIKNLEIMRDFTKKNPDNRLIYSNLTDFFDAMRAQKTYKIPEHHDDLQHHASGCYSAYSTVKNDIRRSETKLLAAEAFSVLGTQLLNREFPTEQLKRAWNNVCFVHFHDIAGGCCIKDAYADEKYFTGEALAIAMKTENNSLQSLSWAIDTSDRSKGTPVIFFNPHPFAIDTVAKIATQVSSVHDKNGKSLDYQYVYSQTHLCYRRCDTLFNISVPAFGYATYYINRTRYCSIHQKWLPELGRMDYSVIRAFSSRGDCTAGKAWLEDSYFRVDFDEVTGLIRSIFDKKNGRELLAGGRRDKPSALKRLLGVKLPAEYEACGSVGIVIDEKKHDTWSHGKNFFDKEVGYFGNATVTSVEKGPLRSTIKAVSTYGKSTLTQYFTLQNDGLLRVKAKLDWHEKQKMLKLAYPLDLSDTKAVYEMPFGAIERPSDGEEECGHMWIATVGKEGGVAMLNDNKYSFSVKNNVMCLTAIRSPYYGDHGAPLVDEECELTDQGETEFSYALTVFDGNRAEITRQAKLFNTQPTGIIENNHSGKLPTEFCGINVSADNIIVSAVKRAEDGKGWVVRAYETDGKNVDVCISGALLPKELNATFTPFSVNTYYLADGAEQWKEVLLTEFDAN